jgi:hypothetical protein
MGLPFILNQLLGVDLWPPVSVRTVRAGVSVLIIIAITMVMPVIIVVAVSLGSLMTLQRLPLRTLMSLQLFTLVALMVTEFLGIAIAVTLRPLMSLEGFLFSLFVALLTFFFPSLVTTATVIIVIVIVSSLTTEVTTAVEAALSHCHRATGDRRESD